MISGSHTIIDSHVHLWNRERFQYDWLDSQAPALQGDFLPSDLALVQGSATGMEFVGSVFVQADCHPDQSVAEAAWVQGCAEAGAPIIGVVAAAQLEQGTLVAPHLKELADLPLVVGVRRLLQDEPPGFAVGDDFVTGVRLLANHNFTMDVCVRERQLAEVADLATRCPDVTFVLDHLGKPTVSSTAFGAWALDLGQVAALPNVRCKLSGLASEAPPELRSGDALLPWLRHAIEVFGPERCMFGSDWPVLTGAMPYSNWLAVVMHAIDSLSHDDQCRVLAETARDTYDLRGSAPMTKEAPQWR